MHGDGSHKIPVGMTHNIPEKYQKVFRQFVAYFGAALVGYIVDFGTLILLTELLKVNYLIAAALGFTAGLIVLYVITQGRVFGESKLNSKILEFFLFGVIGFIGLGILTGLMWLLTGVLGISYIVSKILATAVVYVWNFIGRRSLYHS